MSHADKPIRIAMWSGPRNISTAMMRSWGNRPDTVVIDEPFYAYYLKTTGRKHPGADDVIASGETDWRKVIEPDAHLRFNESTRAIHLWNEMWRDSGQDKNAAYDPACFYEQLKKKYLV